MNRKRTVGRMSNDKPRPVSGEIMTDVRTRAGFVREAEDVIDADIEATVMPTQEHLAVARRSAPQGLDFLRPGASSRAGRRSGSAVFWTIGLGLVALAFWTSGGHALVRQQVAALRPAAQAEGLRIGDVTSRVERRKGRDILFVAGQAGNHGSTVQTLPNLEIVVRSNDGAMTSYYLGTNDVALAPGDRYSFSSRVVAPRNGVRTVSVTFRESKR